MTRQSWRTTPLLLAALGVASAYSYYYSDTFSTIDLTKWTQNGTLSAGSGLTTTNTNGGSVISSVAVPDGTSEYEVKSTLTLAASGGTYVTYLHATSNALSGPAAAGTTYAVEIQNPTFAGSACTATLAVYKIVSGSVTSFGGMSVPCHNGMVVRVVYRGSINTFIDNQYYSYIGDTSITGGQPGVGVRAAPAGNSISALSLGGLDRVAPNAVDVHTIGTSSFPNRVDMQWQPPADDAGGIGVAFYHVNRNGGYVDTYNKSEFSDQAVSPGTVYSYTIITFDFHFNTATTTFNVTTAPSGSIEPRRIGVRPTGSYWGGVGENIDMSSGNLNFTLPLLKLKSRSGWGAGVNLTYNSTNWRQDAGGVWNLGRDVGYGYGWKLLVGSLTPYYSFFSTIDHYIFTDSTGAEYRLDHNTGGVWTSTESIYVSYDSNTGRLYFNDGSFWTFGCTSAGTEGDAGSMYPTVLQDTNGNQIMIRYGTGLNVTWPNSSARIDQIEDVRATLQTGGVYYTYAFTYNTDPIPHLTGITNTIGTSEGYSLSYQSPTSLLDPFTSAGYGTLQFLSTVSVSGIGLTYQLTTDSAGDLTQVNFPYGAYLRWAYYNAQYSSVNRWQREVQTRYLSKDGTVGAEKTYGIERFPGDNGLTYHYYAAIDDPVNGQKVWWFSVAGSTALMTNIENREGVGYLPRENDSYQWSQDANGNYYVGSLTASLEPYGPNQISKKTTQTLDVYGNMTQMQVFDYGNLTTPVRTYTNTYLTSSPYTSVYIRNRLLTSQLTAGATTITIASNTYDSGALAALPGVRQHDAAYGLGFTVRGNLSQAATLTGLTQRSFDIGGNATATTGPTGTTTSATYGSGTNYTVPSTITAGTLPESLSWNAFLGLTQTTGPASDTATTTYDAYGRPQTATDPTGTAVTNYTYTNAPPTVTSTRSGRWTKNTLDGFGRVLKVETGNAGTTVSVTENVYDSGACSPVGLLKQSSMTHANGAGAVWTTTTYDGLGRPVQVAAPDGSSKTYAYLGNVTTSTDEAGHWKKFTRDTLGNLTQVEEPNPAGGSFFTTYVYDMLGHLTSVSMPRPTGTQTRTFNYGTPPGVFLLSSTNPETGTITYGYTSGRLTSKTDAKGQQIQYSYDGNNRVTQIRHYPVSGGSVDGCQTIDIGYDTNAIVPTFSTYTQGRMATRTFKNGPCTGTQNLTFTEMFSYLQGGQVLKKRLRVARSLTGGTGQQDLDASWSYDATEGWMTSVTYPTANGVAGASYSLAYDSMGRRASMTDTIAGLSVISSTTYGPAGELLSAAGPSYSETRGYNSRQQLTSLNSVTFNYAAAPSNNGQITSQTDSVSGETLTYQYDSLNRLISATSNQGWGQGFSYDGFGNLTAKSVLSGSVPVFSAAFDPATNWQVGVTFDANGNQTNSGQLAYDVHNRTVSAVSGSVLYGYDPDNHRLWKAVSGTEEIVFWGLNGRAMSTYSLTAGTSTITLSQTTLNVYYGSRLVRKATTNNGSVWTSVQQDRLGSIGKYFPYGEDRIVTPPNPGSNTEHFSTYYREGGTGLDYAVNRYYDSGSARFLTPDPYRASGDTTDPQSWNRYSYVNRDPVNLYDPAGLQARGPDYFDCDPDYDCDGDFDGTEDYGYGNADLPPITDEDRTNPTGNNSTTTTTAMPDITNTSTFVSFYPTGPTMSTNTNQTLPPYVPPSATDPTSWTNPLPTIRTGTYSQFFTCGIEKWATSLTQDAASWFVAAVVPIAGTVRGLRSPIPSLSSGGYVWTATAAFGVFSISKGLEFRQQCKMETGYQMQPPDSNRTGRSDQGLRTGQGLRQP